jgi:hypothetical protein
MKSTLYALVIASDLFGSSVSMPMPADACMELVQKIGPIYEALAKAIDTPESWDFMIGCYPVEKTPEKYIKIGK